MNKNDVIIKLAQTEGEKCEIYRFRYKIYIDEMHKNISDADHVNHFLKDEMDDTAYLFYAESNGEVIATLRLNLGADSTFYDYWKEVYHLDKFDNYSIEKISLSSRIMVDKEQRGSAALGMLLLKAYTFVREKGVKFDFCNCSPNLIEFYEHLGYRRYCDGFNDENTGYHIPLVFIADDIGHLKKVRSPFYRAARRSLDNYDESTKIWFEKSFPIHSEYINRRLIATDDFWILLQDRLSSSESRGLSLFENMEDEEIQKFIGMSTILKCKKNDLVIRPGDVGQEMFIILSGVAEVKSTLDEDAVSLAVLGTGQVFGEMAFVSHSPRNAAVIAKINLELLVLTQVFFNKAMKNAPEITAKVLLNLSNILCAKLQMTTSQWVNSKKESKNLSDSPQ